MLAQAGGHPGAGRGPSCHAPAVWPPLRVFAAPAEHPHWQGWRVSPASWLAWQNGGVLLVFPCRSAPGGPSSHPGCSCCQPSPAAGAMRDPPPGPSDHSHSSPQHHPFPQALPRCLWQPFHPLMLESWIALALPSYFPRDNCGVDKSGGSFIIPGFGSRAEQQWGCLFFLPSGQKGSQG